MRFIYRPISPLILIVICLNLIGLPAHAQSTTADTPLIAPLAQSPDLSTWLLGQPYGNTVGAYNFAEVWYRAGQGLHFGVDFSAPCGVEVVAVADGTVRAVDDMGFGSAPHNVIVSHDALGMSSLYGHLLASPLVRVGQFVLQGEVLGFSGDPDETCTSRPHLHFELRSLDYRYTLNPVPFMGLNWHTLALLGPFGLPLFQQDLYNPRQWQTLYDQSEVVFWGNRLNAYAQSDPPLGRNRPVPTVAIARTAPTVEATVPYHARKLAERGCCANPFWHPTDPTRLYITDGAGGGLGSVFAWDVVEGAMLNILQTAPRPYFSPDGAYRLSLRSDGLVTVSDAVGNALTVLDTGGRIPTINPASTHLLWTVTDEVATPGQLQPLSHVMLSKLDGTDAHEVWAQAGTTAQWLDDTHILIQTSEDRITTLYSYSLASGEGLELGRFYSLRHLSVAPGGQRLMFVLTFQEDATQNGVYLMEVKAPPQAQRLAWVGAWRWRDAQSVYYIPFDLTQPYHEIRAVDLISGVDVSIWDGKAERTAIADGYWEVSADGERIAFRNVDDLQLTILEPMTP